MTAYKNSWNKKNKNDIYEVKAWEQDINGNLSGDDMDECVNNISEIL